MEPTPTPTPLPTETPTPAPTETPTPTPQGFTEVVTPSGQTIRIVHDMTLGDILVSILLMMLLATVVFKWLASKIWR